MGDKQSIVPAERAKEGGGSTSIQCPMLNSTNYTVWAIRMKVCLKIFKVWETIENNITDGEKNNLAMGLLFQSIPESLILQVGELDTAKKVWEAIKIRNVGAERVKEARLQTLMSEFDRLKMKDSENIDSFVGKLSEISSKSASLGVTIEETKLVKKFLKSLPRKKYIHIVASIEQMLDLNTIGFEEIIGRIKTYEERIVDEEEEAQEEQTKLMYANSETQVRRNNHEDSGTSRGRGRGRSNSRGKGRGRGNGEYDLSRVECYRCDKFGHYASSCPERLLKLQETQEESFNDDTQDADELFMHEVVYLDKQNLSRSSFETNDKKEEEYWYLDNGASNHMTGEKCYFSKLDEEVKGRVKLGNGSYVKIEGKGLIGFKGKTGNQFYLMDVYYIPGLKTNILSLGQATQYGCDITMKEDYLILHDSYGKLILRATRSSKRLYKIKLKVCKRKSLTSRHEESWKCHGSFVKINNIEIALKIRKDKRIPEIEGKDKSCDCCLVEKQNRRACPKRIQFGEILYKPISPSIHDQNRYGFDLRVDKSNYLWNLSLKEKSKAFEKLKGIRVMDEKEVGSIVKGQELSSKPKGKGFSTRFVVRCDETTNLKFEQGEDDITIKQETFFRMIKEVILDMSYSKREVKEMRDFIGIQNIEEVEFKLKEENVDLSLNIVTC